MKRSYSGLVQPDKEVKFFVGNEVEKTMAYGKKTLFVVGLQDVDIILNICENKDIRHVYIGANQSFYGDEEQTSATGTEWAMALVIPLLNSGLQVTWDFQLHQYSYVAICLGQYINRSNFIPMISVCFPHITRAPYNTVIKLDDESIDATNPGVWCWELNRLMSHDKFTSWAEYDDDQVF